MPIAVPLRPSASSAVPSAAPPPDTYLLMAAVQMNAEGRLTKAQAPNPPATNAPTRQ